MPDEPELTIERRRELVLAAIGRIEHAQHLFREAQLAPASSSEERDETRDAVLSAEREFGWQWRNVKALLEGRDA